MEAGDPAAQFIAAGLTSFGIEADEIELAVVAAAHALFWPAILELLELDAEGVEPERAPDLARAPEAA